MFLDLIKDKLDISKFSSDIIDIIDDIDNNFLIFYNDINKKINNLKSDKEEIIEVLNNYKNEIENFGFQILSGKNINNIKVELGELLKTIFIENENLKKEINKKIIGESELFIFPVKEEENILLLQIDGYDIYIKINKKNNIIEIINLDDDDFKYKNEIKYELTKLNFNEINLFFNKNIFNDGLDIYAYKNGIYDFTKINDNFIENLNNIKFKQNESFFDIKKKLNKSDNNVLNKLNLLNININKLNQTIDKYLLNIKEYINKEDTYKNLLKNGNKVFINLKKIDLEINKIEKESFINDIEGILNNINIFLNDKDLINFINKEFNNLENLSIEEKKILKGMLIKNNFNESLIIKYEKFKKELNNDLNIGIFELYNDFFNNLKLINNIIIKVNNLIKIKFFNFKKDIELEKELKEIINLFEKK